MPAWFDNLKTIADVIDNVLLTQAKAYELADEVRSKAPTDPLTRIRITFTKTLDREQLTSDVVGIRGFDKSLKVSDVQVLHRLSVMILARLLTIKSIRTT